LYKNNKHKESYKTGGLYHDRKYDDLDWHHIDCVEDGFCLHHSRNYEINSVRYKDHYHCRYGLTTHSYMNIGMVHGEKKSFSNKFVCFDCRKTMTRSSKKKQMRIHGATEKWPKCSDCHKHMTSVSVNFQPPPKNDIKHWKKLDKEWYDDSRLTYEEYYNGLQY
jgi:superfamily II helicase